jgi:hypothetical protein
MEKADLLLSLLFAKGSTGREAEPIVGITRLTKLLYLLKEEAGIDDAFTFEPYKMGPFSSEIYSEIDFLQNFPTPEKALLSVVKKGTNNTPNLEQLKYLEDMASKEESSLEEDDTDATYKLSETGKKVAQQVWDKLSDEKKSLIEKIKSKYGGLPLRNLLRYVYDKHPEMTVNSEIKDKVYGS